MTNEKTAQSYLAWERFNPVYALHHENARAYGVLVINTAIMANGAALLAIPAYLGSISGTGNSAPSLWIGISFIALAIGILFGVVSATFAYLNFNKLVISTKWQRDYSLVKAGIDLKNELFYPTSDDFTNDEEKIRENIQHQENLSLKANIAAIKWCVASYAAFIIGVINGGLIIISS